MNEQQIQKVVDAHHKGYEIQISNHYVDSLVWSIYEKTEDGFTQWVYDSEVYRGASLRNVFANQVRIYKEIQNWEDKELPELEE